VATVGTIKPRTATGWVSALVIFADALGT